MTDEVQNEKLLRIDEVAQQLSVSTRTVRSWCLDGLIEHVRLPRGRYRIPKSELSRITQGGADGAR
ncbi:MAG: helix-turn-helix domain-containing protein [Trueperaceae bacterium]